MCNLNIFVKSEQLKTDNLKNLVSFLNSATTNSFISNSDGEGFYFDWFNKLITSENKINLIKYLTIINKSKFILGHERISTSGHSLKYLQPFQNEDFILLHNGILSKFSTKRKSDTFVLFKKFLKGFRGYGNRELRILRNVKELLNKSSGSFSIALYDKKTKNLYYFKNDGTLIYFYRSQDKKQLYITTKDSNEDVLNIYNKNFREVEIKDFAVYRINIKNEQVKIHKIDKLKKPKKEFVSYDYSNFSGENNFSKDDYEGYEFNHSWIGTCKECHIETQNYNKRTYEFLCDDCIKYNKKYLKHRKKAVQDYI